MSVKKIILLPFLSLIILVAGLFSAPTQVYACGGGGDNLLSFPPWHKYLDCDDNGNYEFPTEVGEDGETRTDLRAVWLIGAAVLEMITRAGALIAIIFVMWGGFRFMTSGGSPEGVASARRTVMFALIGFVIAVTATAFVSFLMNLVIDNTSNFGIPDANEGNVTNVFRLAYTIAGAIAVLMIVISSLRYVLSGGDPGKTNSARNTLIYSIVGLIVIIFSATLLEFVASRLG